MRIADIEQLLDVALTAARAAAAAILEIYTSDDFGVAQKSDHTPVTLADARAEAVILRHLEEATPSIPVISEERAERDGLPATDFERFWLVDPLDGTKEFISRNGEFTVNIALIENRRPVLGVVGVPVSGLLYAGAGPGSARRIDAEGRITPITCRQVPEDGAIVAYSRSHGDTASLEASAGTWAGLHRIKGWAAAGSALKFCLIAEGSADFYPRLGRTMEWDTAAGHAVVEAAQGEVVCLDGNPLDYGKPRGANPHFVARAQKTAS